MKNTEFILEINYYSTESDYVSCVSCLLIFLALEIATFYFSNWILSNYVVF